MWLIDVRTKRLTEFFDSDIPKYAILSHRWGKDEISFPEMQYSSSTIRQKQGYTKIAKCCAQAMAENLKWVWVDTCCIDKRNSADLSEAINSMYRYYEQAEVCYAYLEDVPDEELWLMSGRPQYAGPPARASFAASKWFTRGWTLQELIAPRRVVFYSTNWVELTSREHYKVGEITGIPRDVLNGSSSPTSYSVAQRFSWSSARRTTRREDEAYCLLGLFGINMPLLYGEGDKAFVRLQEEIIRTSADQSIFSWRMPDQPFDGSTYFTGILATSPLHFAQCSTVEASSSMDTPYAMTNVGLSIRLPLGRFRSPSGPLYIAFLSVRCQDDRRGIIYLKHLYNNQYVRVAYEPYRSEVAGVRLQNTTINIVQQVILPRMDRPSTAFGCLLAIQDKAAWVTLPVHVFCGVEEEESRSRILDKVFAQRGVSSRIMAPFPLLRGLSRTEGDKVLAAFAMRVPGAAHDDRVTDLIVLHVGVTPGTTDQTSKENLWFEWLIVPKRRLFSTELSTDEERWVQARVASHDLNALNLNRRDPGRRRLHPFGPAPQGIKYTLSMEWRRCELDYTFRGPHYDVSIWLRCRIEIIDCRAIIVIEVDCLKATRQQ